MYKDAFEIVDGQTLAISMTKSQYEKQQEKAAGK